jgi:hypothetical protein
VNTAGFIASINWPLGAAVGATQFPARNVPNHQSRWSLSKTLTQQSNWGGCPKGGGMRIPYAYLKQQTWLYRRNYPRDLQPMLGQTLRLRLEGQAKLVCAYLALSGAAIEDRCSRTGRLLHG